MINSVKARTPILAFILFVFAVGSAIAQNKVVVIPMAADNAQWALIDNAGVIVAQSGGISIAHHNDSSASYWIKFGRIVRGHPIIVTPQLFGTVGFIQAALCGDSASKKDASCSVEYNDGHHAYVRTVAPDGNFSMNMAFYITVLP